jgi:hypothetical protein
MKIHKHIAYALSALTIVSALVACGPAVGPTPTLPPPTDEPTQPLPATPTPVPSPTPEPSPTAPAAGAPGFEEGFEGGLDAWQQGADVPEDPAHPGQPVDWRIETSPEQAAEGQSSARLTLDGTQDDGTIWLARPIHVASGERARVRLSFELWSASESFNTLANVAAYAGAQPPAAEEDFDLSQVANVAEGWVTYDYTFDVRGSAEGQAWVALGISAVWETQMTYYIDNVRVDVATAEAGAPSLDDPALLLPEWAQALHRAAADLNGDGTDETVILAGWGSSADRLDYDLLQMFVLVSVGPGKYLVAWQSDPLPTDRAEPLRVQDLNGDGQPEVLSVQAMGANGETLYILGWREQGYGWLAPQGGQFDGGDGFGENGVRVADVDGDGLDEILASYGPATSQIDVYAWEGQAYVYQETQQGADAGYERVAVPEADLSLELPAGWMPLEPGMWAAPGNEGHLGVVSMAIQPPVEPEAALLPQPGQVLDSWALSLAWASGRAFVVEVYGEAVQGEGKAPVETVEMHALFVLDQDGSRRAIDIYTSAPAANQLTAIRPAFEHALESVELQ